MLAVNQYLCTSAEINGDTIGTNLSSACPVAFIWQVVQAFTKPRISALAQRMYTNTGVEGSHCI